MFSDERKSAILTLLNRDQRITVVDVAQALLVSEATIRRDLQLLEQQGFLKRTHGGAVPLEVATFEPSVQEKYSLFADEKSSIANKAVERIHSGDTVLLDAGTTTLEIAKHLPNEPITVVTNSLEIASIASQRTHVNLIMLGGELRSKTGAFVGPFTESMLKELNADKLFLGANGIDLQRGVTTPNAVEAATKQAMIQAAHQVILVADHSKLDQIQFASVCQLNQLDVFISDLTLPSAYQAACEQHGVEIVIADGSSGGKG